MYIFHPRVVHHGIFHVIFLVIKNLAHFFDSPSVLLAPCWLRTHLQASLTVHDNLIFIK